MFTRGRDVASLDVERASFSILDKPCTLLWSKQSESLRIEVTWLSMRSTIFNACLNQSLLGTFRQKLPHSRWKHLRNSFFSRWENFAKTVPSCHLLGSRRRVNSFVSASSLSCTQTLVRPLLLLLPGSWSLAAEGACRALGSARLQVHGLSGRPVSENQLWGFVMSEGWNPLSDNWTIKDNYAFSYISE